MLRVRLILVLPILLAAIAYLVKDLSAMPTGNEDSDSLALEVGSVFEPMPGKSILQS